MSEGSKKTLGPGWVTVLIIMGLIDLGLLIRYLIHNKNIALFNPQGWIAQQQHELLSLSLILLFAGAIPVVLALYFVAWKYRESNEKVTHKPEAKQKKSYVFLMWAYPALFFFMFTALLIPATHKLEPRKLIASDAKTLNIEVISLRWKWLFIYPDQGIATVNYLKLPKDTPVTFHLTADEAPMSSFWIPNLGGQLYSMTSHVNKLNLLPTTIGDYPGRSAEINGEGFSGMTFTASVVDASYFDNWVNETKQSGGLLDDITYSNLVEPSESTPPITYAKYDNNLYAKVLNKYSHGEHSHGESEQSSNEEH